MRSRFKIISICFLALLFSCEAIENSTTAVTVMVDRTDTRITEPTREQVITASGLDTNPGCGILFTYQNIGDMDFNPEINLELVKGSFLDNTLQRKNDVKKFYQKLDTVINLNNAKEYSYNTSSVLLPLVVQLQKLKKKNANNKVLILYSDLQEFSDVFNVYKPQSSKLLLENPNKVALEIKDKMGIDHDFSNITLMLSFYPQTRDQNRRYKGMLKVYQLLFQETGLNIKVGIPNTLTP